MAVSPLANSWRKFHWALKHAKEVDAALRRTLDPDSDPIAFNVEIEGQIGFVRISKLPILPVEIGLMLGDALQGFRAALDHLAWGLVKVGRDPFPERPRMVYYPMATSARSFDNQVNDRLPGIPDAYRTLIKQMQPYRRGEDAKALRALRNLSDTDKHRVIVPTVVNMVDINLRVVTNWPLTEFEFLHTSKRALKIGTKVMRFGLLPVIGEEPKVEVQGQFAVFPSLGQGVSVMATLGRISRTVRLILTGFDRLL